MSESGEIILTTEETGQLWSACVWDPRTGTALMTYKGADAAGPRSACFLGNDYLLLSDKTKPVLNAWPLNSQHPVTTVKFACPGKVNAMAVTPDGFYCVTAVGNQLFVYQITSGRQLAVVERHFQSVTCIKFTDDGSHFVSGGEDGQVLVWTLAHLVSAYSGELFPEQTEPRYIFSDHALPVRDIFVGTGGMRAHFVSVSLDKSCRIYDLSAGQLLATILFESSLSAITMNAVETMVFMGALTGHIFQVDLGSLPRTREHHVTDEEKGKVFAGHSKLVTCLSVSQDGTYLLSGSYDRKVILWDIPSRQSIRTIEHKGTITNAFFAMAPKHMFSDDFKPVLVLNSFQKTANRNENEKESSLLITVRTTEDHWYEGSDYESQVTAAVDDTETKDKLMEVTKKNADLYKFAMEKIFKTFNNSVENKTNEDEKMEAEEESSNSEDSQFEEELQRKKMVQQKKVIKRKNKKFSLCSK